MTTDAMYQPSTLHLKVDKETLYRFQVENKSYDNFIKTILRSYGGIFGDFVKVSETEIASRANVTKKQTTEYLANLDKLGILSYVPQKESPQIIFSIERLDTKDLFISKENYHERKRIAEEKLNAVIHYVTSNLKCRSQLLLSYFGEEDSVRCGQCDVCLERNKLDLSEIEFDAVIEHLKPLLQKNPLSIDTVVGMVKGVSEGRVIKAIQWLIDNDKIVIDEDRMLSWKK
jgi:ATP-dependent DNA helicase RecQ